METTYLAGLALGLALIVPIGAQNVFVVGQGLAVGWPRAGWAVIAAGCCDTLLILAGAAGVSGLLTGFPALRGALLLGGAAFLTYLGVQSWRSTATTMRLEASEALRVRSVIRRTVAVSLLNPHAILDTVGVIGSAVAAQAETSRMLFAGGALSASWIWFLFLAAGAAALRRYLTPRRALWFERISGMVMLLFAAFLLLEFVQFVAA
ncbi:L-lysine exporter family protein LysE/ArgO [Micromonospora nigra]|uniref:L-lysine exporter family protein LysE/ArgO n=1 Tax=Micromonospora nigra TaxID=145857 RepID=A0A1C6T4V5_9ACTN|nr:LysE family transporter [Micromonospora nigra]SCL36425.1 L-lysine exporter family protein LysE/ArgO [Micromonospora nigra]